MVRFVNRSHARILAFHRFPAEHAFFEKQCRHVRDYYHPVSLDEVTEQVRAGTVLPANAVALTVDDGYLDFFLHAYPILKQYGIPATVFLMTDFIDGRTWPWWDQVEYAFAHTKVEQSRTCAETIEGLKRVSNEERLAFLAQLPELFHTEIPARAPAGFEAMTWEQIREMSQGGITFGAHTKNHPILSSIENESEVTRGDSWFEAAYRR